VDLNHRPRPYPGSVDRFYNNLQDRGDCQNTRKSYKTSQSVGWVVGWKKSTNSVAVHIHFLETRSYSHDGPYTEGQRISRADYSDFLNTPHLWPEDNDVIFAQGTELTADHEPRLLV